MSRSASDYKNEGNAHLQAKNFDEAIKSYSLAIELDPKDHVFFSNRSAAYLSKGDAQNALKDGEQCILLNSSFVKGYSRKGAALHALKRYDDAIKVYETGLNISPTDAGLKSALADVQNAKESAEMGGNSGMGGLFGPQMLAKLVGHPKFGPKLADPAFMAKIRMMQSNPQAMLQDPEMMEVLQAILGGMGDMGGMGGNEDNFTPPPQAAKPKVPEPEPEPENLTEEEMAVREIKKKATALKEKGNTFYKEKNFQEAIKHYEEAFSTDPSNILYKSNLAAVYIEMGECDKAIAICNEALELGKQNRSSFDDIAKVYQRIAGAHLKKNDVKEAIEAYKTAQFNKKDKDIERKIKNLELDYEKLKRDQYVNPELGLAAKERGNTAFRDGKYPEAIQEYEEAVKRDPKNAPYRNNLAAAYLKMGLFNEAKKECEKSLELDRNYVKAWAKKGDIELYMKEYHKAMDSYRAGLQIDPTSDLCKQGMKNVEQKIYAGNQSGAPDTERAAHAMADPEIQMILQDPVIRTVLQDMQDPARARFAQDALNDITVRTKIEKLVAAGILQVK